MRSRTDELDQMKRINLCQYAVSRGFVLDRRLSSRASAVLRHPNGDKLIVARSANGHYVYFNAKGDDNGTIIDLIQTRDRISLGEVRKTLRPWLGKDIRHPSELPTLPTLPFELQPSEHDAARVLAAWLKAKPIGRTHSYLESERCIPQCVVGHPIFRDRIRRDDRHNALFPHFNPSGLCGFEIKNHGWTGFASGGIKGLACSRPRSDDREMVVCETAIDMLSYAALKGLDGRRFFSTAGQISPLQADCLRSAFQKMPAGSTVTLALDNDDGGRQLADQVRSALVPTGCVVSEDFPPTWGEDWNDVLRRSVQAPDHVPVLA